MSRYLVDLRSALRALLRSPGGSLVAVGVLAMGIGFPTSMFSIVRGGTRGLPFDEADELVVVAETHPRFGQDMQVRPFEYLAWKEQQGSFEDLAAFATTGMNVSGGGDAPERFAGAMVTPEAFGLLGAGPALGRAFGPADAAPGAEPTVVLSHDLWVERFGGDPNVVGTDVRANGEIATVVGVMPEGFRFPINSDLWQPLTIDASAAQPGTGPSITVFGRLLDGVDLDRALVDLGTIGSRIASAYPDTHAELGVTALPFTEMETPRELRSALYLMVGLVSLVLLIACANVANLLLARAAARTHDIALRGALGAPRGRIMAVHLFEALLLSVVGAAIGVFFAAQAVRFFGQATSGILEAFWMDFRVDWVVAASASALAAAAALAAGLAPALRASRLEPANALRERAGGGGLRIGRLSRGLIGVQVAFACVLLILTTVFVQSALGIRNVDFAYVPEEVLTAQLGFSFDTLDPAAERSALLRPLVEAVSALPEVEAAAIVSAYPGRENAGWSFSIEGDVYANLEDRPETAVLFVTPGYFDVLGAGVVRGRDIAWADDLSAPTVAVVNEPWVARFSADADPLGRRISVGGMVVEVVGVVPHLVAQDVEQPTQDGIYVPFLQRREASNVRIMAAVGAEPLAAAPAVRAAVASVDPDLPIFEILDLREAIYADKRVLDAFSTLFFLFGLGALFMTVVGLYGVVSFAVSRRTREIGIRVALGAKARDVARLVVREGSFPLGMGAAIGLLLAAAASTLLSVAIGGILRPATPALYALVAALIALTTAVSFLVPVRSALGVQPARALKAE